MTTDGGETSGAEGATDGDGTAAYADLGATTELAMPIAETSMDRVHELVDQETPTHRLRAKAVHATGDPEFAHLMRFANDPVAAGAEAVLDERPIVTDISRQRADRRARVPVSASGERPRGPDAFDHATVQRSNTDVVELRRKTRIEDRWR